MTDASLQWESDQDVWMVMAFIQPFRLDAVTLALEALPEVGGMTVSDCRGFGRKREAEAGGDLPRDGGERGGPDDEPRAPPRRRYETSDVADFSSKLRVEVAVAGQDTAAIVAATIAESTRTGRPGDGKVMVGSLAQVIRIRTGETGVSAL